MNKKEKLYKYQIQNMINIIKCIKNNGTVLDASDTGTGKTYTAVATCKELNLNPIVVCPKAVMRTWYKVCEYFDVKPFFIVNYETLKYGKYYVHNKRKKCPYIFYDKSVEEKTRDIYRWKFKNKDRKKIIFIFDEVHKCTNFNTFNGLLLLSAKDTQIPLIILSATLADSPNKMKMFSYILNFIDKTTVKEQKISFDNYLNIIDKWLYRDNTPMIRIHNLLYPDRATRMRIDGLGDLFPETQISAVPYNMGEKEEQMIQKEYDKIADLLEELKEKKTKDKGGILVAILRARQKIELLKIPTFIELTKDFLEENKSVVIFVNFTATLKILSEMLNTKCLIYGEQTDDQRQNNIDNFQENIERIIICNISAGGVGVSLHDLYGNHMRVSLISPCFSSIDLKQALGRIHRAGGKTKSIQRIIYTANTIEEQIADKLQIKLKDLNSLNNGDLDLTNVVFER